MNARTVGSVEGDPIDHDGIEGAVLAADIRVDTGPGVGGCSRDGVIWMDKEVAKVGSAVPKDPDPDLLIEKIRSRGHTMHQNLGSERPSFTTCCPSQGVDPSVHLSDILSSSSQW